MIIDNSPDIQRKLENHDRLLKKTDINERKEDLFFFTKDILTIASRVETRWWNTHRRIALNCIAYEYSS